MTRRVKPFHAETPTARSRDAAMSAATQMSAAAVAAIDACGWPRRQPATAIGTR